MPRWLWCCGWGLEGWRWWRVGKKHIHCHSSKWREVFCSRCRYTFFPASSVWMCLCTVHVFFPLQISTPFLCLFLIRLLRMLLVIINSQNFFFLNFFRNEWSMRMKRNVAPQRGFRLIKPIVLFFALCLLIIHFPEFVVCECVLFVCVGCQITQVIWQSGNKMQQIVTSVWANYGWFKKRFHAIVSFSLCTLNHIHYFHYHYHTITLGCLRQLLSHFMSYYIYFFVSTTGVLSFRSKRAHFLLPSFWSNTKMHNTQREDEEGERKSKRRGGSNSGSQSQTTTKK